MSDQIMTNRVRAAVLGGGMDLVGFAPVSRWEQAPYLLSPPAILPEARTVIVGALYLTDAWIEMGGEPEPQDRSPGGWQDHNGLMDRIAYRTARLLRDAGYQAIPVVSSNIWRYRQYAGIPSLFAPDLSHIHAAVAAGLGEIGWSGLAITPEFGSRVRFVSIVTDAELTPTPMYNGPKLCDMCGECVRHCPSGALKRDLNDRKPHEVTIGGRVFRYANKNIWRCAWAEHFNLDLNSETLTKTAHIDERVILSEIQARGVRGHERGVCQKVCIPPHLRSDKPSFGRNRKIAQNRINRRYPESLPTLRKIRDDVFARASQLGFDLMAVGPIAADSEAGRRATLEVPGVRTALTFAMRVPSAGGQPHQPQKSDDIYGMSHSMVHFALIRLARLLEDCGYEVACYGDETACEFGVQTGMGTMADGLFTTPELGVRQQVGAIVTDAPLEPVPWAERRGAERPAKRLTGNTLRCALEKLAADGMVDLFGVTSAERLDPVAEQLKRLTDEAELGRRIVDDNQERLYHGAFIPKIVEEDVRIRKPSDYLPGAKAVIVMGMSYPKELVRQAGLDESQQIGCYNFFQFQTRFELRYAALELANTLDRMGYGAVLTENLLGIGSYTDSPRGPLPDMRCGALEAVAAGLGDIGTSGALLTPKHGPHQRTICLITDAELDPDRLLAATSACARCKVCVDKCPMTALGGEMAAVTIAGRSVRFPLIPRHRCDWAKRYSLCPAEGPALIGNNTNVKPPEGVITMDMVAEDCRAKDPIMKCRTCILEPCLKHCPAGSGP
ncbi:MAG: hypothetical protein PHR35_03310 [Kiritimatiellae bacterium]|nr:hypothetical protein [Kiritimatiellia bacterium]